MHALGFWLLPLVLLLAVFAVAWWRTESASARVQRGVSVLAIISMMSSVYLGFVWPSLHTLLALTVAPALSLLGVRLVNPGRLRGPLVRVYLRYAVVVPPVMWGLQSVWLLSRAQN